MFGELEGRGVRFDLTNSPVETPDPLTSKVSR
jgi:hypothetical protein